MKKEMDLYSDYLLSSFGQVTATGLSALLDNALSHDKTALDKLPLQAEHPVKVWIKDLAIEVLLCKFVFTNKDGSTGEMYLLSNDMKLSAEDFRTLYKKRWSVEEYHKSLKQNTSLAKSPTRTVTTQTNHLFVSLLAYIKLERLKFVHKLNHFALKGKIYFNALKRAWRELELIKNYVPA